ncbi:hypothetical protein ABI214_24130 [Prescottella soli]|uniref:Uncharacterized protein n=1 Tax=Prescottella soli TaxID=1543852 RepID=A0ABW9FTN5_9NOCA
MGKKPGRKSQNRPPKPAAPPKRQRQSLPEIQAPRNGNGGTVTATFVTHQDSILPVPLKFPPPLAHLAADPSAFEYNWQHLTYAFHLPDPATFAPLTQKISAEDRRNLLRFVQVCEKTAGYTVVSHKGGATLKMERGEATVEFEQADDEDTVGFSVRFRQLHKSSVGDPDFENVANILAKYSKNEADGADERMAALSEWRKTRGALMNRPLQNIVCRMVLEKDGYTPDKIAEHEMYGDVNPNDIINLFNYGELIHFGQRSEEYDELAEDPEKQGFKHHDFITSMLGLIHVYFGFSRVIVAALASQMR